MACHVYICISTYVFVCVCVCVSVSVPVCLCVYGYLRRSVNICVCHDCVAIGDQGVRAASVVCLGTILSVPVAGGCFS